MLLTESAERLVKAPESSDSIISPNARRMLEAIDSLPENEREVFSLVRIQTLSISEAAQLLGVCNKTIKRRLDRSLMLLTRMLLDIRPPEVKSRGA